MHARPWPVCDSFVAPLAMTVTPVYVILLMMALCFAQPPSYKS
jgi:hypothetical protein